jgi:beta-amylase
MRCGPEGLLRQVVATADRHGVEISAENALYRCDAGAYKQMVRNSMGLSGDGGGGMHSFTFLRLCESLMEHDNFAQFETFVRDMSGDSAGGR